MGAWWPGDARSQGISSHDTDLIIIVYFIVGAISVNTSALISIRIGLASHCNYPLSSTTIPLKSVVLSLICKHSIYSLKKALEETN